MDAQYKKYLKSDKWAQIKLDLYEVRGRKCERCGSPKSLQVHHKRYDNLYSEEPDDLEILCGGCHGYEHYIFKKPKVKKVKKHPKKKKHKRVKRRGQHKLTRRDKALQKRYNSLRKQGKII